MSCVFLLDPDAAFGQSVSQHFEQNGLHTRTFHSPGPFFNALEQHRPECIILEMVLDEACCGLDVQFNLAEHGYRIPLIFAARQADTTEVVRAMKNGAHDFLVKPVAVDELCKHVHEALVASRNIDNCEARKQKLRQRLRTLTSREREVLNLALTGRSNKQISPILNISPRTVETHRARVLSKIGLNNLLELAHIFADMDSGLPDDGNNPPL